VFAIVVMLVTARLSRRGLEQSLQRPIQRGFGPPCTLWQAWCLFCSLFWERVLLSCVAVACALRLTLGHWRLADIMIAASVAAGFPFAEYFIHRYVLHGWPGWRRGDRRESVSALVHRVHHRDPWHMERAQNPPIAVIGYAVGLPILWFPLLPLPQGMTGVACSWLVLLVYEWTHLLIHTSYKPRNWLFKRIWRNHRLHHFKNEYYWFNVSTLGVDALLHTAPPPGAIPTSETCMTLDEQETRLR
jgi:sterol desaturase/sphingolipid hydroxylase (fatty acid hydroxylase superfamily)